MTSQLMWVCAVLCFAGVGLATPIDTVTSLHPVPVPADIDVLGTNTPANEADVPSATEGSKMSRFLDDVTSAFKQGTAKMKESFEIAATSVKDGVLQGYDYVRSKLTGTGPESSTPVNPTGEDSSLNTTASTTASVTVVTAAALTSAAPSTPSPAISHVPIDYSKDNLMAFDGAVGVSNEPAQIVPNDDDNDDRVIFEDNDEKPVEGAEDERDITELSTVAVDNRFILAGPLACKSGQEAVNGKCRNVF